MSYNIKNYEPLVGKPDPLHRLESFALWGLVAASVVNVAYYAKLLMTLVLLPLGGLYSSRLATGAAAALLGILTIYGFAKGLMAALGYLTPTSTSALPERRSPSK